MCNIRSFDGKPMVSNEEKADWRKEFIVYYDEDASNKNTYNDNLQKNRKGK